MSVRRSRRLAERLWLLPTLAVLALTVGAGMVVLGSAYDGVSWDPSGRVLGVNAGGPAERAGLRADDVVLAVDGCAPTKWKPCERWLYRPGEVLSIVFQRGERVYTAAVTVTLSPAARRMEYLPGLLVALVSCLLSLIVLLNRPETTETRLFYAMGHLGAAALAVNTLSGRLLLASRAYNAFFSLLSPVLVHFHAVFPKQQRWLTGRRWLLVVLYGTGLALGAVWPLHPVVHNLWMLLGFCTAIGLMATAYVTPASPRDRQRIRLVVFGTLLGFGPIALLTVAPAAFFRVQWVPLKFSVAPLLVIPVSYAIALWRHNLLGFDRALNRGLVYLLISAIFFGMYFVVLALFHSLLPVNVVGRAALGAAVALVAATTFRPLRDRIQRPVDRLFYGGWYDYRGLVEEVGQALACTLDLETLAEVLVRQVPRAMHMPGAALWLERDGKMELAGTSVGATLAVAPQTHWAPGGQVAEPGQVRMAQDHAAVPLVVEGQVVGVWALAARPGGEWGPEDERILTALGRQAALAAQNVRLVVALRSKVAEVEEMHRRLLAAREEERADLARELHDGAIQDLIGLRYRLEACGGAGEQGSRGEAYAEAGLLVDELRRLCSALRPSALDQLGLAAALRALAREVTAQGLPVEVYLEDIALPDKVAIGLYRICQEALSNALYHAGASRAVVMLTCEEDGLVLAVADDGRGFDPPSAWEQGECFGLRGMSERAEALGGHLTVESVPGAGTRVTVRCGLFVLFT